MTPSSPELDRDVDSRLAALRELYSLLLAAKRVPGIRVPRSFLKEYGDELVAVARREGADVSAGPHPTAPEQIVSIAVRWPLEKETKV